MEQNEFIGASWCSCRFGPKQKMRMRKKIYGRRDSLSSGIGCLTSLFERGLVLFSSCRAHPTSKLSPPLQLNCLILFLDSFSRFGRRIDSEPPSLSDILSLISSLGVGVWSFGFEFCIGKDLIPPLFSLSPSPTCPDDYEGN